jgi:hypothetical protein
MAIQGPTRHTCLTSSPSTLKASDIIGAYRKRVITAASSAPIVVAPRRLCKKRWSGRLAKNIHINGTSMSGMTEPTTNPGRDRRLSALEIRNASG